MCRRQSSDGSRGLCGREALSPGVMGPEEVKEAGAFRDARAHHRHPTTTPPGVIQRYWHRLGTRLTCATSATAPHAGHRQTHSEVPITRHSKGRGTGSPYAGDGSIGARDRNGTQGAVLDWRRCSNSNVGAVPPVGCSCTTMIGWKSIL